MTMKDAYELTPGVLASRQILGLVESGSIRVSNKYGKPEIGASALDLRLGKRAWKLREGQRPTTRDLASIQQQSVEIEVQHDTQGEYFDFDAKQIYLVQLDQILHLPRNVSGRATGKSSIGRLDIITRLVSRDSGEYDVVSAGYEGELFLLILPQTFSIRVAPGGSLNQLRLFCGPQAATVIPTGLLQHYGTPFWYVRKPGTSEYQPSVPDSKGEMIAEPTHSDLTVDLADPQAPYVFRARTSCTDRIDLRPHAKGTYDPQQFFDEVHISHHGDDHDVILETNGFYIMKSRERLYIPTTVAVEVIAISERIGDIRIHYAGFAHPGFGRAAKPPKHGTPLIFEVRATDMTTRLSHGSTLARIQFFRMSEATTPDPSDYEGQELKLSSVFREWE